MKEKITLSHGDGTKNTYDLIREVFLPRLSNPILNELSDAAKIGNWIFSCDSFTVNPIYFPSSDIGKLAVYGTVNDICVSGGLPLYLSLAVIVEEGFLKKDLEKLSDSIKEAANISEVKIVSGDFKVIEKKKIDKIFIITSGIGKKIAKSSPSIKKVQDQDRIIITGTIAEHGIAVMLSRNRVFDFNVKSDCQCLKDILIPLWKKFPSIRFMRDPTRGGIASTLNEVYLARGLGIKIFEDKIPMRLDVKAACELLGIDPYYLACEGRALIVVEKSKAKAVLKSLKERGQANARIVGEVSKKVKGVLIHTVAGGKRILDFSYSFSLPRIC